MQRRDLLVLLPLLGCAPTPQQQAAALTAKGPVTGIRSRQSRLFDTTDRALMMRSTIGALQDLGYTIDETQAKYGIVVGSKLAGGRIRVQAVLQPAPEKQGTIVRVTFQTIMPRPGAMLAIGDELSEPELYRGFFDKLAQSAFLTAHEI